MVIGILLFIYLLFGRVVPWALAVTITIFLGHKQKIWTSLLFIGLIGLVEDVAGIRTLGVSSIVLLSLWGLVWFTHRQYRGQWGWWYVLGVSGEILFRFAMGSVITWESLVGQLIALWLVRWLLKRIGQPEGIYVEK